MAHSQAFLASLLNCLRPEKPRSSALQNTLETPILNWQTLQTNVRGPKDLSIQTFTNRPPILNFSLLHKASSSVPPVPKLYV